MGRDDGRKAYRGSLLTERMPYQYKKMTLVWRAKKRQNAHCQGESPSSLLKTNEPEELGSERRVDRKIKWGGVGWGGERGSSPVLVVGVPPTLGVCLGVWGIFPQIVCFGVLGETRKSLYLWNSSS